MASEPARHRIRHGGKAVIQPLVDTLTVLSLMITGIWLEGIGGKHNLADELLAPVPLGLGGIILVLFERLPA